MRVLLVEDSEVLRRALKHAGFAVDTAADSEEGLAPLARLGQSVAAVDATSLATRFPSGNLPDELRPTATRLNELLARLEFAFARERRFTATVAGENVTLHFKKRSSDLTPADMPHVFERFWRKDPARADARYHGLGLALAAEFATLLGGTLAARIDPAGELDFARDLPGELLSPTNPAISPP